MENNHNEENQIIDEITHEGRGLLMSTKRRGIHKHSWSCTSQEGREDCKRAYYPNDPDRRATPSKKKEGVYLNGKDIGIILDILTNDGCLNKVFQTQPNGSTE